MNGALGGIILILAGVFTAAGGVMDWDWFMNNRRARLFVGLFGRQGARVVYIILGILIVLFGLGTMVAG